MIDGIANINEIDRIVPISHNRICVIFKDGTEIETTDISFTDNGEIEFGYIYQFKYNSHGVFQ